VITTIDVDEFVYPCETHWGSSDLFRAPLEAVLERPGVAAAPYLPVAVRLECYSACGRLPSLPPPPPS
jgi:hypothetical protein